MIPLRLSLKNFLSYREEEVNLEGVRIACLCGENGAGKSALLDAMTWALWGKARGRSNEDLVYSGQQEMRVELDFQADHGRYRVVRQYSRKGGRHQADLLALGHAPRTLGHGVNETEARLRELLRLDYDTFVHSAFLVQGRDDAFTAADPRHRKEVLAEILGLSRYEEWAQEARARSRARKEARSNLERELREIREETSQKASLEQDKGRLSEELKELEARLQAQEARLQDLLRQEAALKEKQERLAGLERDRAELEKEVRFWNGEAQARRQKLASYDQVLARAGEIEQAYALLGETRRALEEMDSRHRDLFALREGMRPPERVLAGLEARQQQESQRAGRLPSLEEALQVTRNTLASLPEKEVAQERERLEGLSRDLRTLEAALGRREAEGGQVQEKLHLLASPQARCPLCDAELLQEKQADLLARFQAEDLAIARDCQQARRHQEELSRELNASEKALRQKEAQLSQARARLEQEVASLGKQAQEAREAQQGLAALEAQARELRSRLQEQEEKARALGYDEKRHGEVRGLVRQREPAETQQRDLEEARKGYPQEKEALGRALARQEELARKQAQVQKERQALALELAALPTLVQERSQSEAHRARLAGARDSLRDRLIRVQERLARLEELAGKQVEKEKDLSLAQQEEATYQELAEALGRGGVPALIIERALPELEAEANQLLARMTDGRLTLSFVTQEPTKEGTLREVLEIEVHDGQATRGYPMYSGGEAFRINLALRIALARFLARRAGAPLPILIIDEGFGSQDAQGRESVIEAINSIAGDFEKIIAVTHIEELQEMFPVRLLVTKTEAGSRVTLIS